MGDDISRYGFAVWTFTIERWEKKLGRKRKWAGRFDKSVSGETELRSDLYGLPSP